MLPVFPPPTSSNDTFTSVVPLETLGGPRLPLPRGSNKQPLSPSWGGIRGGLVESQGIHHCPVVMRPCPSSAPGHLSPKRTLLKYTQRHIFNPEISYEFSVNTDFVICNLYLLFIYYLLFHNSSSCQGNMVYSSIYPLLKVSLFQLFKLYF